MTDEELRRLQSQLTDAANADAVLEAVGLSEFRYVSEWDAWIAWDGRRWSAAGGKGGARDRVVQAVIRVARVRYVAHREMQAETRTRLETDPENEALKNRMKWLSSILAWLVSSQNSSRIGACVSLLQGLVGVTIRELDQHPWLFNVANGTIDLRTGELAPHRREDLLTQISDIHYDPDATCPAWRAFIESSMGGPGSALMQMYLQRVVGYQMTGSIREQCLVFHFGDGSNGKSTFRSLVQAMMGDYAVAAPRGLVIASPNGQEPHPAELARLYGKRFVACAEVGEGERFAEAKIKDLTGGDIIAVRRMNENWWDLYPTHKLDCYGNHKPKVTGSDNGIWRRIRLVPWLVTVTEGMKDRDLAQKLRAELPGILAWGVAGCLEWQRNGLAEPPEVLAASAAYRTESDVLGEFLVRHCVFGDGERCARKDLRKRYETWCEELGHYTLGARALATRLKQNGVSDGNVRRDGKVCDGWYGVRLKTDTDDYVGEIPTPDGTSKWSYS